MNFDFQFGFRSQFFRIGWKGNKEFWINFDSYKIFSIGYCSTFDFEIECFGRFDYFIQIGIGFGSISSMEVILL